MRRRRTPTRRRSAPRPRRGKKPTTAATRRAWPRNMRRTRCCSPPGAPGVRGRAAILAFFRKDIADAKAGGVRVRHQLSDGGRGRRHHRLGIRHVQGDGQGRRRRDREIPVRLAQEGRQVALHPRHVECGRDAGTAPTRLPRPQGSSAPRGPPASSDMNEGDRRGESAPSATPPLVIAPARADDAAILLDIQKRAFAPEGLRCADLTIPPLAETLPCVLRQIESATVLVARAGPAVIGSVRGSLAGRRLRRRALEHRPRAAGARRRARPCCRPSRTRMVTPRRSSSSPTARWKAT